MALMIECPECNAAPGDRCNAPTWNGNRVVTWFHHSRIERAEDWSIDR